MFGQSRIAWRVWSLLLLAQLREQPVRMLITVVAIALGVALGTAVYLVNNAALNEFGLASKRLVGSADLIVQGPREAFPESVFVTLAHDPAVSLASPILELEAAIPGVRDAFKVLGVDVFRASAMQPQLMGDIAPHILQLFATDSIIVSNQAAVQLHLRRGDLLQVIVGSKAKTLHILDILSPDTYSQSLGIMDIASAQWIFESIGDLNRVDLRVKNGVNLESFKKILAAQLPASVLVITPQVERDRAVTVTRAYRVNLNMLAMIALLTGAFLVFSTQSLSVLRRRHSLALLRALGVTRLALQSALLGEGVALGVAGSLLGVLLGTFLAAIILQLLVGDLGNNQLQVVGASLRAAPLALIAFLIIGTVVTSAGAWFPARSAARQSASALKGAINASPRTGAGRYFSIALLGLGIVLTRIPAVGGIPLFGYLAVAALLFGSILLVPLLWVKVLRKMPRTHHVVLDTAVAQMRDNVKLSTLSLSSIIVSFSLMVAMAIMVYSFRVSFDHWLTKLLPADMQMREPLGNDTAFWSVQDQARLTAVAGVSRIDFRRTRLISLDAVHAAITLIARDFNVNNIADILPLVQSSALPSTKLPPIWISEAVQDIYGYKIGSEVVVPLAGRQHRCFVAGIWRDYARPAGAIVISRQAYQTATGDHNANEGSIWLSDGQNAARVAAMVRAQFALQDSIEIVTSSAVKERSMKLFDHAFVITYALEAVAVLIGLAGLSFATSSTALARRAEFGMLKYIGLRRRQVIGILATEGMLSSVFGAIFGLTLGAVLSLVLVFVINRQSFNWSIDLAVPIWQLAILGLVLVTAATLTAIISGRAATAGDAVRAVREDW